MQTLVQHGHPRISHPEIVVFTALGRLLGRLPAERTTLVFNFIMNMLNEMAVMRRVEQEIGEESGVTITSSMQMLMQIMANW